MYKLCIKSCEPTSGTVRLQPGINRLGRSPENGIVLDDPTVSCRHCEIVVEGEAVRVRDLDSSNGTFVDGLPVVEAMLQHGQTVHLGAVEAVLEDDDVRVAIPPLSFMQPSPPPVPPEGRPICLNHPSLEATLQCTKCGESFCDVCVHRIRRVGGAALILCPSCSNRCVPIPGLAEAAPKTGSLLGVWFARVTQKLRRTLLLR